MILGQYSTYEDYSAGRDGYSKSGLLKRQPMVQIWGTENVFGP